MRSPPRARRPDGCVGKARLQERLGNSNWVRVKVAPGKTLEQTLAQLRTQSNVEYAEPNYVLHANASPDDPEFGRLWGLHQSNDVDIDAPAALDRFGGGSNTVVVEDPDGVQTGTDLESGGIVMVGLYNRYARVPTWLRSGSTNSPCARVVLMKEKM